MKVTQVALESYAIPSTLMITWISGADRKLKPGMIISLENKNGLWKILAVYATQDHSEIKRGWNNNI